MINKKLILTGIGIMVLLLVGTLVTGGLGIFSIDRQVDISIPSLEAIGISNWTYEDFETDRDTMYRVLISPTTYKLGTSPEFFTFNNTCTDLRNVTKQRIELDLGSPDLIKNVSFIVEECFLVEKVFFINTEKQEVLDAWEDKYLVELDAIIKEREDRIADIKVNEGDVTLKK